MSYCPKCGGTGVLLDGSPCDCKTRESDLFADVVCLEIPETYRGIRFDPLNASIVYGTCIPCLYGRLVLTDNILAV